MFFVTFTFGQSKEAYQKISDSLLNIGQKDELVHYFETELKKYPKNENVLRALGYAHIVKNNLDLGEKYYLEALKVNPKCARCYLNIGRIYSLRGDNKKALDYFDTAVQTDSNEALLYSYRGKLKEMLGDKFGALSDHNKAIKIDPNNPDSYIMRGLYNSNSGYPSSAISDLTKAITLAPKNYYPYFHRSSVYLNQRRVKEALKDINKAIEIDSSQSASYIGRAAIFYALQEYQKAINDYSKAISVDKNDYASYINRALIYYELEDLDASCADYSTLKSFIEDGTINDEAFITQINGAIQDICNSSKPSYYYQRGVGYYNKREYQKALDIYAIGLKKFPDDAMMLSFKGNTYLILNEFEKALACYSVSLKNKEKIKAEIKINPRFSGASSDKITSYYNGSLATIYLSISECNINLGRFNEAFTEINKGITVAPSIDGFNKEAYFNMRGYIYVTKKDYKRAINDFNESIKINKNYPLAYVNRAIAKVSSVEKIKFRSFSIYGNFNTQPLSIRWNSPTTSSFKKSESTLLAALSDCNTAIEIDNTLGFAFYIRGQIKQMLAEPDYCLDLLAAKELGITVDAQLLNNCIKAKGQK
ncbi:Lipopolysaccharide assembly protein B [Kordia antarctica]|uniref:Lipopolysaccharide assembly protein B n=2 Tax=Kordia antarctica TaxID=1218801 RepID=A0A7L4ZJT8_9FLAO|nr:Lipopolysaccharide assembly protein B [Kordia antarctica]